MDRPLRGRMVDIPVVDPAPPHITGRDKGRKIKLKRVTVTTSVVVADGFEEPAERMLRAQAGMAVIYIRAMFGNSNIKSDVENVSEEELDSESS